MRVALVSDTHMPARGRALPGACRERLAAADVIVHAGDLSGLATLVLLRGIGPPVAAVHGNVDDREVRAVLPGALELDLPGLRLAVVHDGGPASGRLRRLRRRFPEAGAVVFGHSHRPLLERDDDGFLIVNPGSPTDRRREPRHTMAELRLEDGAAPEVTLIALDPVVEAIPWPNPNRLSNGALDG